MRVVSGFVSFKIKKYMKGILVGGSDVHLIQQNNIHQTSLDYCHIKTQKTRIIHCLDPIDYHILSLDYTYQMPRPISLVFSSRGAVTWNKQPILPSIPSEFARPYARLRFTEGEKHIDSGSVAVGFGALGSWRWIGGFLFGKSKVSGSMCGNKSPENI